MKTISRVESEIYKILDELELTADKRMTLENLVDELTMWALKIN